jgi:hypothetical protein
MKQRSCGYRIWPNRPILLLWCLCVISLAVSPVMAQRVQGQRVDASEKGSESASGDAPLLAQPQQEDVPEIFGGREAEPGAWPWQVALVFSREPDASLGQYCGGTLIEPEWILTAAHCVEGFEPQEVDVVLGRHQLSSDEGERIAAGEIMIHPNFNYYTLNDSYDLDADIALIHLATPSTQQPVALFSGTAGEEETLYVGATVTGWGLTDQFRDPDALHEVVVPFVSPDVCTQAYGDFVTEGMICAGYPKGYKDACYGDSGGPLVVHDQEKGGWLQIGIVSWGEYCGLFGSPGVYTRIASFTEWLDACLTDAASQTCTGSDAYEPDDQPQQATLIQSDNISQTHHLHTSTDRDWVKFEAEAGSSYHIQVQPLGSDSDPLVWLYDSDGITPLAYDDDSGGGKAANLMWHAGDATTLFVEIQDAAKSKGDETDYRLTVQEVRIIYLPIVNH